MCPWPSRKTPSFSSPTSVIFRGEPEVRRSFRHASDSCPFRVDCTSAGKKPPMIRRWCEFSSSFFSFESKPIDKNKISKEAHWTLVSFLLKNQKKKNNQQVCYRTFGSTSQYLALINRTEGLYGRILIEVVSTDRMQWGSYTPTRSRFSHTDRPSSINKTFFIWETRAI